MIFTNNDLENLCNISGLNYDARDNNGYYMGFCIVILHHNDLFVYNGDRYMKTNDMEDAIKRVNLFLLEYKKKLLNDKLKEIETDF